MLSGHLLLDPAIKLFRLPSNSKQVFKLFVVVVGIHGQAARSIAIPMVRE